MTARSFQYSVDTKTCTIRDASNRPTHFQITPQECISIVQGHFPSNSPCTDATTVQQSKLMGESFSKLVLGFVGFELTLLVLFVCLSTIKHLRPLY